MSPTKNRNDLTDMERNVLLYILRPIGTTPSEIQKFPQPLVDKFAPPLRHFMRELNRLYDHNNRRYRETAELAHLVRTDAQLSAEQPLLGSQIRLAHVSKELQVMRQLTDAFDPLRDALLALPFVDKKLAELKRRGKSTDGSEPLALLLDNYKGPSGLIEHGLLHNVADACRGLEPLDMATQRSAF